MKPTPIYIIKTGLWHIYLLDENMQLNLTIFKGAGTYIIQRNKSQWIQIVRVNEKRKLHSPSFSKPSSVLIHKDDLTQIQKTYHYHGQQVEREELRYQWLMIKEKSIS